MSGPGATRFWLFGAVGAVMVGASIALVAWAAYGFGLIGSCSSTGYSDGGPVPTCSGESVVRIIAVFPAIVLGLVGLVVAGRRAKRDARTGSLGLAAWSLGYLVVGTALILSGFDPSNDNVGGDRWGWAIPGIVFIPLGLAGILYSARRRKKAATAARLLADGVHTRAEVTSVEDTNVTINGNPRIRVELRIKRPDGPPVTASKTMVVSRLAIPRAGETVDVWYDPADPETFALGLGGPAAATATPGEAATSPAQPDLTGTLERLAALHAEGVLTDAEFEAAKARTLSR